MLRRIARKAVMILLKKDVLQATGSLQLCGGQDTGSEATLHVMHDIFNDDKKKGILLTDADNAFNSANRQVVLHNLKFICLVIATYISNCCMCPARLFIIGGGELLSKEGTTYWDNTTVSISAQFHFR